MNYPVPYQPPPPPLVRPTSGLATASMILGIVGLVGFCLVVPSVLAVILGHFALPETRTGERGGHGQAIAGLIMGYIVAAPMLVYLVFMVVGIVMTAAGGTAVETAP